MMITHLLFSLSLLSFVLSCTSFWSSSGYWVSFYNSNRCLSLLRAAMNKNCWFLVFNGLLVLLAKTSGFAPSSAPQDLHKFESEREYEYNSFFEKDQVVVTEASVGLLEPKEFECKDQLVIRESCDVKLQVQIVYEDKHEDDHNYDDDDHEDDDGSMDDGAHDTDHLSNEELNKKFEEFIRRMKEQIRVDEILHQQRQQQLIMVK